MREHSLLTWQGMKKMLYFLQLKKYNIKEFHFIGLDAIYDYFELNIKAYKTDESYEIYKKLQYALNKLGIDDMGYMTNEFLRQLQQLTLLQIRKTLQQIEIHY